MTSPPTSQRRSLLPSHPGAAPQHSFKASTSCIGESSSSVKPATVREIESRPGTPKVLTLASSSHLLDILASGPSTPRTLEHVSSSRSLDSSTPGSSLSTPRSVTPVSSSKSLHSLARGSTPSTPRTPTPESSLRALDGLAAGPSQGKAKTLTLASSAGSQLAQKGSGIHLQDPLVKYTVNHKDLTTSTSTTLRELLDKTAADDQAALGDRVGNAVHDKAAGAKAVKPSRFRRIKTSISNFGSKVGEKFGDVFGSNGAVAQLLKKLMQIKG